jgi:hypothetical protein
MEATAQWAMDYVYPGANEEQKAAPWFLRDFAQPLEIRTDAHEYGAYLFPFFQARKYNDPETVRRIWDNTASQDSLTAIQLAIPDGFEVQWPEFARHNWNSPPNPLNPYEQWDGLTVGTYRYLDPLNDITVQSIAQDKGFSLSPADIKHLAATYFRFRFLDNRARNVIFRNGLKFRLSKAADDSHFIYDGVDSRGAEIRALVKIEGQDWTEQNFQDWTYETETYFCRDLSAERLEELILIFSNSEWLDRNYTLSPQGLKPALSVSNLGCAGWEGEVNYTNTASGEGWSYTTQSTAQVSWHLDTTATSGGHRFYQPEGNLKWSVSGTDGFGCQLQGGGDISIEWYLGTLWTDNGLVGGPDYRRYHTGGFWVSGAVVTKTCPDGVSTVAWDWQWLPEGEEGSIQSDGVTIEDTAHQGDGDPGGPRDWTWRFTAVRES